MRLREVVEADLPLFFEYQRDPESVRMSGVEPRDRDAFFAHWRTIVLADPASLVRTIDVGGVAAGDVVSWQSGERRLVGYWLGREFWGRGIASAALAEFLRLELQRPLHAYVSDHNAGSIRVLEKCGFRRVEGEPELFELRSRAQPQDLP